MKSWTRRKFVQASLMGGGAALLARRPASASAYRGSANGNVRIAIVGVNNKGNAHIRDFRKIPGVTIAALCDVDRTVLEKRVAELAGENVKVAAHLDFRKVLDDRSIDAVVLATPNHWHSLQTVWACQAGKDVYVEKPISHNVWEGRQCVEAARRYKRIVQAGAQSRSAEELQQAVAYIREGNLGRIQWARGLCYKRRPSIGNVSGPQPVPQGVEYDLWSGPAPLEPPRRNGRPGPLHYDWHWLWNYGGGDIANQGFHQMDICRWFLGEQGLPPTVTSIGGRLGYVDDGQTPNTQIAVFGYETAPLIFEVRGLPTRAGSSVMDAYRGIRVGIVIQCEGGYFSAGESGGGFVYDNDGNRIRPFTGPGGGGHYENFIQAVRSRRPSDLNGQIEDGHISSALCHVANISHRLGHGRSVEEIRMAVEAGGEAAESVNGMIEHLQANEIDLARTPLTLGPSLRLQPRQERFESAEDYDTGYWANTLLKRTYRDPFVVPETV